MGVESYTELYTTIFGWQLYNNLWHILTASGLIFLPFLGMIIRNFIESSQTQYVSSASFTTLRQIEIDLLIMLTVMVLAGQPLVSLDSEELKFVNLCVTTEKGMGEQLVTAQNDRSLYRQMALKEHKATKVPLWWYGVMAVSGGITHTAKRGIPCVSLIHQVQYLINTVHISDPILQSDIRLFVEECYLPTHQFDAVGRRQLLPKDWESGAYEEADAYLRKIYSTKPLLADKIDELFTWIGSPLYLSVAGTHFYAGRIVRQIEYPTLKGKTVHPTCRQFWLGWRDPHDREGLIPGLYQRLKQVIDSEPIKIKSREESDYEYLLLQLLPIYQQPSAFPSLNQYAPSSFMVGWASTLGGLWGTLVEKWEKYPVMFVVQEAAPVVQALLLMSVYLMLPIGLLLSGFSMEFLIMGAVGIFVFKFLAYFFHLAKWVNQSLMLVIGVKPETILADWLIPLVNVTLYIFFPLLFVAMVAWAGYQVSAEAHEALGGEESTVGQGGAAGPRLVLKVADKVLSVISAGTAGAVRLGVEAFRAGVRALRK